MKFQQYGVIFILSLIIIGGAGSIVYTVFRLRHHQEYLSDTAPKVEDVEKAKGQMITLTETKSGNRKWVLKMKEIKYSKDNSAASLMDIKGLVYGDDQKVLFTFCAPKGEYRKDERRITLVDGAKMSSPSTKVFIQAPRMEWSAASGLVNATGGVLMQKADFGISRSEKAVFSTDFSKIQFMGGATTILGSHSNTGAEKPI